MPTIQRDTHMAKQHDTVIGRDVRAKLVRGMAGDEGVALVLALCVMLVATVVGASLMLLSQTETYASLNYRSMTQARYAAESGVHGAMNFLLNSYTPPTTDTDYALFDTTVSPVKSGGQPVVLSANPSVTANYPIAAQQTNFAASATGSFVVGGPTMRYTASATLMSMQRFYDYSTGQPKVIQTWSIVGDGTTDGARPATVEVSTVLEQQKVSFNMYAFFATNNQCGALSFSGGEFTDSYDSSLLGNASAWSGGAVGVGVPVTETQWGHAHAGVGTNGNLTASGSGTTVNGSLSTPRSGVGSCSSGSGVDALTLHGSSLPADGIVQLPQPVSYPAPALPSPLPPTGNISLNSCGSIGATCSPCSAASLCGTSASNNTTGIVLRPLPNTPMSLGDVRLTAGSTLHLTAGTYNINSISLAGNSNVVIDSGPVVMNVVGTGVTNPVDLSGGTEFNNSFNPENFQILYGGTGGVTVTGNSDAALMVYAPNAAVKLTGGSAIYGSVLGATITDTGGTGVHYDRHLPSEFATAWNTMLSSFSWKKS
jgi:Tfp pilus assembly protein PilX